MNGCCFKRIERELRTRLISLTMFKRVEFRIFRYLKAPNPQFLVVNHGESWWSPLFTSWKSMEIPEKPGGAPWLCALSPLQSGLRRFRGFYVVRRWWFQWRFWMGNHGKPPMLGKFGTLKLSCHWSFSIFQCWDILDGMMIMFGKHWICHWSLERFGWLQLTKWLVTSRARTGREWKFPRGEAAKKIGRSGMRFNKILAGWYGSYDGTKEKNVIQESFIFMFNRTCHTVYFRLYIYIWDDDPHGGR